MGGKIKFKMSLPKVEIQVLSNSLGRVATVQDSVCALVLGGAAATSLAQNTAARVFSVKAAEALGIIASTHPHAYTQISNFFAVAGTEAELWIMLVPDTTLATAIISSTGPLYSLVAAAAGRVTLAGFSIKRQSGYTPGSGYFDYDVAAVAAAAQTIAQGFADAFAPLRIILEGSYLNATKFNAGDAFPEYHNIGDRVSVFCGAANAGDKHADMGRFLGWLATETVEVHPAKVKRGAYLGAGYLTTGVAVEKYVTAQLQSISDAGIISLRYFVGMGGAYITDDPTLAATTSDFASLARGRVIDKAIRLTYITYINELNETIDITEIGKIAPTQVAYLRSVIERSLKENMVATGNISAATCYINPNQNVLATDKVEISISLLPRGYAKYITVQLGFTNPANQA